MNLETGFLEFVRWSLKRGQNPYLRPWADRYQVTNSIVYVTGDAGGSPAVPEPSLSGIVSPQEIEEEELPDSNTIQILYEGSDLLDCRMVDNIDGEIYAPTDQTLEDLNNSLAAGQIPALSPGEHEVTIQVRRSGQTEWADEDVILITVVAFEPSWSAFPGDQSLEPNSGSGTVTDLINYEGSEEIVVEIEVLETADDNVIVEFASLHGGLTGYGGQGTRLFSMTGTLESINGSLQNGWNIEATLLAETGDYIIRGRVRRDSEGVDWSDTQTFTLTVEEPASITNDNELVQELFAGGEAVILDGGVMVTGDNIIYADVQAAGGRTLDYDLGSLPAGVTETPSVDSTLIFTGEATAPEWQTLLRSVTIQMTGAIDDVTNETVTFTVSKDLSTLVTDTRNIRVNPFTVYLSDFGDDDTGAPNDINAPYQIYLAACQAIHTYAGGWPSRVVLLSDSTNGQTGDFGTVFQDVFSWGHILEGYLAVKSISGIPLTQGANLILDNITVTSIGALGHMGQSPETVGYFFGRNTATLPDIYIDGYAGNDGANGPSSGGSGGANGANGANGDEGHPDGYPGEDGQQHNTWGDNAYNGDNGSRGWDVYFDGTLVVNFVSCTGGPGGNGGNGADAASAAIGGNGGNGGDAFDPGFVNTYRGGNGGNGGNAYSQGGSAGNGGNGGNGGTIHYGSATITSYDISAGAGGNAGAPGNPNTATPGEGGLGGGGPGGSTEGSDGTSDTYMGATGSSGAAGNPGLYTS